MILSQKTRIALDESETHLRDDITEQMRSGLDGPQAFQLTFQPFWPDDASVMRKLPTEEMRHVSGR